MIYTARLCGRCQTWHAADQGCELRVSWPVEPTPAQLFHTTIYTLADWQYAYDMLHWRDDWPTIAEWAQRNPAIHPRALAGFVQATLQPEPFDLADPLRHWPRPTVRSVVVDWIREVFGRCPLCQHRRWRSAWTHLGRSCPNAPGR